MRMGQTGKVLGFGKWARRAATLSFAAGVAVSSLTAGADPVTADNWASITAPIFGTREQGDYAGAELFAGPNKFDNDYFHGVLPNGRIVRPAGISTQVGMNPLGVALTPDGKYLITTNNDERDGGIASLQNPANTGGYSLSVVETASMQVVSHTNLTGPSFIGLQVTGSGPYTLWVSGGPDNKIKLFAMDESGTIASTPSTSITVAPITPPDKGFVSNYKPAASFNQADAGGNKAPVPTNFDRVNGAQITFPAGSALSPDGKFLYVACNGDNSLAVIDTAQQKVVKQIPVGYFPYAVAVSADGKSIYVSNWGITEYKFKSPAYGASQMLTAVGIIPDNQPDGFYVPPASTGGSNPRSSSVSFINVPGGDGSQAALDHSVEQGKPLDELYQVGDTHPSVVAIVGSGRQASVLVTRTNDDSVAVIPAGGTGRKSTSIDLSPLATGELNREDRGKKDARDDDHGGSQKLVGSYPNALAVSGDGRRVYVAEAGLNSVAVLEHEGDTQEFHLVGRIPTGWYPTALALSPDNKTLYVVNAKGIGEDLNPATQQGSHNPIGVESFTDGNFIFGAVQKVDLASTRIDRQTVLSYNFAQQRHLDTSIVPAGGKASSKIKHVIFILHENKTFDSMLGSDSHFGPFASTTFNNADGSIATDLQFTPISVNTQLLAHNFATAVKYYSDSEESDAGHQFCASGTASDYTEKTLLVKSGRGLLVNKNFEPEDYPAGGYIFNNAARHGVSFKDYGAMIRIVGTDTGSSTTPGSSGNNGRTSINDPPSGNAGYPSNNTPLSPNNVGDVTSPTQGLGQSYFMSMPLLAVLGGNNANGEPRIDRNYPAYNFNISDQRRALEFCQDFDGMAQNGTLPKYLYVYQPNDHTGSQQAKNMPAATAAQQVADGDVALGMVVQHIMNSPVYYDASTGEGAAIFITYDDAQSSRDHIHEHRTPLVVVSPYAKPGYLGKQHYSTASVVKTEELLLGFPANNLGDLLATDLRDVFQSNYNGITAASLSFNRLCKYEPSREGQKIWDLVHQLDTSAPDRDSRQLGALARISMAADRLHARAAKSQSLGSENYKDSQQKLYTIALKVVHTGAPRDADD